MALLRSVNAPALCTDETVKLAAALTLANQRNSTASAGRGLLETYRYATQELERPACFRRVDLGQGIADMDDHKIANGEMQP